MLRYTLKRLVAMVVTLFVVATATFFILAAVPGDALTERTSKLPEDVAARVYARYGLDKPVLERYFITMDGDTVQSVIAEKGPISARLGLQQVILGAGVGILLGILATLRKGTWVDYGVITFSILMVSVPTMVVGLLIQKVLAGDLGLFPVIGWPTDGDFLEGIEYTVLPTLAGSFGYMAMYARLVKASMSDVLGQDYVLAAEARGLSRRQVVLRHMVRNAAIPVVTKLPMTIGMCVTGSFFVESIFSIPGLGRYYVQAISGRDVTMVMGFTVVIAALFIAIIFVTDILYHLVDPRIKLAGSADC